MREGFVLAKAAADTGDMEKINRFTRRRFTEDEVYVFTAVLCDNETDRDFERFTADALRKLAVLFIGKTCIFDHERKSANQTARIFDTFIEEDEAKMTEAGEPYTRLAAKAYLPRTEKNREVITAIDSGILREVSVSCAMKRTVCGICGKEVCSHERGKSYGGQMCCRVLCEPADAYECSFVAVPAQRGAGVVKQFQGKGGETVQDVWKAIRNGGTVEISREKAQEISARVTELEQKAAWGEKYRTSLTGDILKYSALIQPEMPRRVMESSVKGLDIGELEQMEAAYKKMAQKKLPLEPQLVKTEAGGQADANREFRI